jgi:hypothetical protein
VAVKINCLFIRGSLYRFEILRFVINNEVFSYLRCSVVKRQGRPLGMHLHPLNLHFKIFWHQNTITKT